VKRRWLPLVLGLLVLGVPAPASADPTMLFASKDFSLQGRLTGTKLVLAHINLTNLPLDFRCRTEFQGRVYRTHGFLAPHLAWRDRYPSEASRLRGASATCTVTLDTSFTVLWEGQLMEVLGKGFVDESTGEPGTLLIFQNISAETVRYSCTWEWDDPPTASRHDRTHQPPHTHDSIATLIDFSTVSNMACTEEVYDP